jgi:VanZ family protein
VPYFQVLAQFLPLPVFRLASCRGVYPVNAGRWWPPLAWAAVVVTATSIPNVSLPGPSGTDKAGHFFMYGMLGFLVQRAATSTREVRVLGTVMAVLALFAAADEWHQAFIPGRSADVVDWVADTTGIAAGSLVAFAIARRRSSSLEAV